MSKMSIWTIEGRLERIGKKISESRIEYLKNKRNRQLSRLIAKHKKDMPKRVARWEAKLAC